MTGNGFNLWVEGNSKRRGGKKRGNLGRLADQDNLSARERDCIVRGGERYNGYRKERGNVEGKRPRGFAIKRSQRATWVLKKRSRNGRELGEVVAREARANNKKGKKSSLASRKTGLTLEWCTP